MVKAKNRDLDESINGQIGILQMATCGEHSRTNDKLQLVVSIVEPVANGK